VALFDLWATQKQTHGTFFGAPQQVGSRTISAAPDDYILDREPPFETKWFLSSWNEVKQ